jgi:MFS family permease
MFKRVFYGWYVILVSGIGIGCGLAVFISATVSLLVAPLHHDLGFTPQEVFNAPIVATGTTVLIAPFLGRIVDRLGSKKVIISAFTAEAFITASFNFLTPSVFWFLARYSLFAILATGTTHVAFAPLISKWFDRKRGTALGVVLAGIGLGGVVWSLLTQSLFNHIGWRHTFLIEGAIMLCVTMPLQLLVLRETPQEMGLGMDGVELSPKRRVLSGMTFREARRTPQYWLLLVFALLVGSGGQALALHLVSILRANKESASMAAATQASLWMALVFGRLLTGWLMDRYNAPRVGAIFLLPALAGIGMLSAGATGAAGFAAAMLVGVASGAEVDVIAYLASRSFGLRYFSSIYSTYFAAFSLGGGLGPSLTALAVKSHGYPPVLIGLAGIFLLAALLLLCFPKGALSARSMETVPDLEFVIEG